MKKLSEITDTRTFAILQAFFVTILWSSSWPIIKFGLEKENLPPLTFAGLRYVTASIILILILISSQKNRAVIKRMSRNWWMKLVIYGLIFYTITQGAQFFGLLYHDAITVSLLLSFTPILVLILAFFLIREIPNFAQAFLVIIALSGAIMYFLPLFQQNFSDFTWKVTELANLDKSVQGLSSQVTLTIIALIVVIIGVIANALSSILGRAINKSKELNPLVVTTISMFIGSIILLAVGLSIEEFPQFSPRSIFYILLLSVVNTAFAFTLWNHAMQKLRAVEITVINNTMLFQITILAVVFLNERPSLLGWVGLVITAIVAVFLPIFGPNRKMRIKNGTFELMNDEVKVDD
ncbi:MAG: EamA family transporter [Candidatus Heimdallarchaeota archaeon]|nr:EamA family transporter [Candidatus Heimdallarchaeota archaeon]MCK4954279.1 EamA family transporter [Candidatus Heimdallarchaeota archaeon]